VRKGWGGGWHGHSLEQPCTAGSCSGWLEHAADLHTIPTPVAFTSSTHDRPMTCRYSAAALGHVDCLRLLLQVAPETAAAPDKFGTTPAHFAAQKGHTAALDQILAVAPASAGAVNSQERGLSTPLHLAAATGHAAAVGSLVRAAPGVATVLNAQGGTACHTAVPYDHDAVVAALLKACPGLAMVAADDGKLPIHDGKPSRWHARLEGAACCQLACSVAQR